MFDAKAVIMQVQQKRYPSSWRVYRGKGRYGCAIEWLLGAVFLTWVWCNGLMWQSMNLVLFLIMGIPFALCVVGVFSNGKRAIADKNSILVILPESVIQCYGGNLKSTSWLYFPNIDRIELAQQTAVSSSDGYVSVNTSYWLDIYASNGNYFELYISDCFGNTAFLCKTIIAAYKYYWYSRAQMGR